MAISQTGEPPISARLRGGLSELARRLMTPWTLIVLACTAIVIYLAVVPLWFLIDGTFAGQTGYTLDGFRRAFGDGSGAGEMLVNTLVFAGLSTVFSMMIATPLAFILVRTDAPLKPLFFAASLVPLIIPGVLYTPAWIFLADNRIGVLNTAIFEPLLGHAVLNVYSMPGMVWVHGLHNAPIAFLLMAAGFRAMDPSLEESALASGAPRISVFRRVTLPLLRPALVTSCLLLFVQGIESFEVPALLGLQHGIYVLTSRIYVATHQFPVDYAAAGAMALTLLAIAAVAAGLSAYLVRHARHYQTISGKAFRPRPIELGRARPWVAIAVIIYFFIAGVLPLLMLVYTSLLKFYRPPSVEAFESMSFDSFREVLSLSTADAAIRNSLILAIATATFVMLLTAVVAWVVSRTRVPGRRGLDVLTLTPLVVPGLVLGLALIFIYLRVPLPIYGTLWIMLISFCTQHLPYGMRFSMAAVSQVGEELEESALVSGASRLQAFRRILIPLMSAGLFAGWVYIVIHTLRSLSTIILLYSPGRETISVLIFSAVQNGDYTVVAAIGVILMLILLVLVTFAYKIGVKFGLRAD
jgi:iron(III) transport system permease protein